MTNRLTFEKFGNGRSSQRNQFGEGTFVRVSLLFKSEFGFRDVFGIDFQRSRHKRLFRSYAEVIWKEFKNYNQAIFKAIY
jgi:hypothetical protein